MDSNINVLTQAWQLHQQGQHAQAEALYRRAMADYPGHPGALYGFGRLAFDVRHFDVAAEYLARAAAADPRQPQIHADLAQSLQMLGRLDEAAASYRRAIELEPNRASVHVNLGNTLLQAGQLAEAIASYRRALQCDPTLADAHSCLGAALEEAGGNDEAEACYRRAIELRPDYAQAYFNLGTLQTRRQQAAAAVGNLEKVVELQPNFAPARHNLGVALNQFGKPAEAQRCFELALQLDPTKPRFHFNLGEVLEQQGHVLDALPKYDESLRLDPKYGQARCARGTALLKLGRFEPGWRDYESRVGLHQYDTLSFPQPLWDGSPLGDRKLLIHSEQGLGDTLQFIRYVKLVRQRARHVIVASRPDLIPLFAQSGYTNLISRTEPLPPFDVHAPLMSLPRIFGTELDSVPSEVPYVSADQRLVDAWRNKLAPHRGFKIGLHWQGNTVYRYDRYRSIPLEQFAPLAQVRGALLFGLQKFGGRERLDELAGQLSLHDLGPEIDDESGTFMDTSAVMRNLDLVITSDTSVAHLAGALGVRVWLALGIASEWRWLLERDDSPWYPTMRLFRQTSPGDWPGVFQRMATELANLVSQSAAGE